MKSKKITGFFVVLAFTLIASSIASVNALAPTPVGGTATVDGNISEWGIADITNPTTDNDYFAPLYLAGKEDKPILGYAFLRYDQDHDRMYALVIANQTEGLDLVINQTSIEHWIKVPENNKVAGVNVPGTSEFAWATLDSEVIGFEASFELVSPISTTIDIHLQLVPSDTAGSSGTAAVKNDLGLIIPVDLPVPEYALGGLIALAACFTAFAVVKKHSATVKSNL